MAPCCAWRRVLVLVRPRCCGGPDEAVPPAPYPGVLLLLEGTGLQFLRAPSEQLLSRSSPPPCLDRVTERQVEVAFLPGRWSGRSCGLRWRPAWSSRIAAAGASCSRSRSIAAHRPCPWPRGDLCRLSARAPPTDRRWSRVRTWAPVGHDRSRHARTLEKSATLRCCARHAPPRGRDLVSPRRRWSGFSSTSPYPPRSPAYSSG